MKKISNFFERISQIIEYYDIKSVNDFAKSYLGYQSSEKINRLKDPIKNPSFEILVDISNKFEEINTEWLLLGKGEMLRNSPKKNVIGNGNITNNGDINNSGTIDNRQYYNESLEALREQLDVMESQLKEKDAQISRLLSLLESK